MKTKVLIAEDQALIALAMIRFLNDRGYETIHVLSGEEAVDAIDDTITIAILDIGLGPGIDGIEAAQRILATRDLPLIFHSGYSDRETLERARKTSPYGFVLKNSKLEPLLCAMDTAMKLHSSRIALKKSSLLMDQSLETGVKEAPGPSLQDENRHILMRLTDHIKNSLLVMLQLLPDRLDPGEDPYKTLHSAKAHISSLARFFQKVFFFPRYELVEARPYLESFVQECRDQMADRGISIQLFTEHFSANIQILFLVGIILRELILDTEGQEEGPSGNGTIFVSIVKENAETLHISVSDDGLWAPGSPLKEGTGSSLLLLGELLGTIGISLNYGMDIHFRRHCSFSFPLSFPIDC